VRHVGAGRLGLLLFLLAGCSTPATQETPAEAVAAAASKTAEAKTARVFFSTGQREAPKTKLATGRGVVDFSRQRVPGHG